MRTADFIRIGAKRWNLSEEQITGERKMGSLARRRQVICYFAYTKTGASLPKIARVMGGRDHTTILHAVKVVKKRLEDGDQRIVDLCAEYEAALDDYLSTKGCPPCVEVWKGKPAEVPPRVVTYIPPGGFPPAKVSPQKERTCLSCGDTFMSSGPGNRRCNKTSCRDTRRSMGHLEGVAA